MTPPEASIATSMASWCATASDVVRSIYSEAGDELSDTARDLRKHARASEARHALEAMLELAKSLQVLEAEAADFDANAELLNTHNGVVNLRTGELRPRTGLPHDQKRRLRLRP